MTCPYCRGILDIRARLAPNQVATFSIDTPDGLESDLLHWLIVYWRWCAEGKPEHKTKQYWYDTYHAYINFVEDHYEFSLQLSDSPEGDTWVRGTFIWNGHKIIIQTKEYSRS